MKTLRGRTNRVVVLDEQGELDECNICNSLRGPHLCEQTCVAMLAAFAVPCEVAFFSRVAPGYLLSPAVADGARVQPYRGDND